jgi:hypothetical protein
MSFQDAPPEKTALQSDAFRNFGIPILFFGGLAYFIWAFSHYMWRTAEEGTVTTVAATKATLANAGKSGAPGSGTVAQAILSDLKDNRDTPGGSSSGSGVVPSDSASIQALVDAQRTGKHEPTGRDPMPETKSVEEEGPGIVSIMQEKGPRPKVVSEWKMRGTIYDLITLKPVPGVHMIFTDNATNSKAQIKTDEQGRYRTILPALPGRGYLVTLSKTGYLKSYLDPGTEGVSDMPLERRKEIVSELASLIAEPAALQPNSGDPLLTDFHMAPK